MRTTSEGGGRVGRSPKRASEVLARRMFELSARGRHRDQLALIHPEARLELAIRPGEVMTRAAVAEELERAMRAQGVAKATAHTYEAIDDDRVAVGGRLRWPSGAGFRDSPVSWAFVFVDGLLFRSWAAPSLDAAIGRLRADALGTTEPLARAGEDSNLRPTD